MKLLRHCALLLAAAPACLPEPAATALLAGWASISITPGRPVALEGQVRTRISQHVQDPVTATALAIEARDGDTVIDQAILVSCDLAAIRPGIQEPLRERLRGKLPGFDLRKLVLNATHTHTAPVVTPGLYQIPAEGVMQPADYLRILTDRLAEVVVRAWEARAPAGVSWSLAHAVVGHNRRPVFADGKAVMYGKTSQPEFRHIEGYEDHSLHLLFFWDAKARLVGVMINLACPSQVVESASYVSADFWHDVRALLRKRHSKELFVFPMTGAAGDQSPHLLLLNQAEARLRSRLGLSEREEIGRRISNAVDEALAVAKKDVRTEIVFRHKVEDLRLPLRKVTREDSEQARQAIAASPEGFLGTRYRSIIHRYEHQDSETDYPMELHVLRLGDIAIATNPFELFLDYGLQIQARSRAEQTLVVQLAGGSGFYLPTARAVAAGGYGTELRSSLVGPEGGQILVDRTVAAINSLFPE